MVKKIIRVKRNRNIFLCNICVVYNFPLKIAPATFGFNRFNAQRTVRKVVINPVIAEKSLSTVRLQQYDGTNQNEYDSPSKRETANVGRVIQAKPSFRDTADSSAIQTILYVCSARIVTFRMNMLSPDQGQAIIADGNLLSFLTLFYMIFER
jgi:hypothetical protein